ncbi:MAG TPA: DUF222 domain-containing protein [Pedococcus sp.]|nr:DUF222 domain-containing protein [Pedococcus sp.]
MAGIDSPAQPHAGPKAGVGAPEKASAGRPALATSELRDLLERLGGVTGEGVDDAERIDQLSLLESIKGAAAAAQAKVTVAFDSSQREAQAAAGVLARERGRGVAAQIALARRDSPARGSRHLGLARALTGEMPHTMEHLAAGRITEWRATIVCRETAVLDVERRREVDARLAADLPLLGDAQIAQRARAMACELDGGAVVRRRAKAQSERCVTLRPAPDTMTYLTALLPVAQGVAVYAALTAAAGQARGAGDVRGRGQLMADTLVERVTGQATAAAVPIEIQLVMPAETLLGQGSEPALVPGYGALPAVFARALVASCGSAGAAAWVRRLFTTPDGRDLVTMDSRRRSFRGPLRHLIELRDQTCRTPWCDAPIRHGDHVIPERRGGATSAANGQGLCEACNYAKEAPGWHSTTLRRGPSPAEPHAPPHMVRSTTPTGHAYDSTAPPVLPTRAATGQPAAASALEHHLERLLAA